MKDDEEPYKDEPAPPPPPGGWEPYRSSGGWNGWRRVGGALEIRLRPDAHSNGRATVFFRRADRGESLGGMALSSEAAGNIGRAFLALAVKLEGMGL